MSTETNKESPTNDHPCYVVKDTIHTRLNWAHTWVLNEPTIVKGKTRHTTYKVCSVCKLQGDQPNPSPCDLCHTHHIDGEPCNPKTCEHDYDHSEGDYGWMVCIYCADETGDDRDGHVEYDYQDEEWAQ